MYSPLVPTPRDGSPPRPEDLMCTALEMPVCPLHIRQLYHAQALWRLVLRQLAEGKIGWAFWPPGTDSESILVEGEQGTGIWIPRVDGLDEEESEEESNDDDDDSDEQEDVEKGASDDGGGLLEEEESDDDDVVGVAGAGRFGALVMEDPVDDGSEGSLDA